MILPIHPPIIIYRHPTLLNQLHAIGLVSAHTQTTNEELACLERYAANKTNALEIGTYMGVSAVVIAEAITSSGTLTCIDPWLSHRGKENPCLSICRRQMSKSNVIHKVKFLQGTSFEVGPSLSAQYDFIFIDGDHSYTGLQIDWGIVINHLQPGGIVCLHDTTVPDSEPYRSYGSVEFFAAVIHHHPGFEWLECCHSMNIMRKVA